VRYSQKVRPALIALKFLKKKSTLANFSRVLFGYKTKVILMQTEILFEMTSATISAQLLSCDTRRVKLRDAFQASLP